MKFLIIFVIIYIFMVNAMSLNHIPPKGCYWNRWNGTHNNEMSHEYLTCKLRTINKAENLFGTLRNYEAEKILNLRLECSDVMFFESSLESITFVNRLTQLKDLTIEYCKIRYVPSQVFSSLRDLRTLNMRTHNSDWSAINLELHPESFRGLTELRNLNLAENNIWSVPTDVFCPLYSLRVLNLTGNRLNDVSQLGFSDWGSNQAGPVKACNTGLEILNLSKNDITVIFDSSFSALRSLEKLLLQNNHLTSVAEHAYSGLQSLQILNISSNKIKSLPSELFRSSRKLREIYLQNNTISSLSPGLFDGLDRLQVLDLSNNHLTSAWINQETFTGLIRLVILNLKNNHITNIDEFIFRELYGLQVLQLDHNNIETISPNSFSDLKNLVELTLSHNRLKRVDINHFSELFELKSLFIESNIIENIDPEAFNDLTRLNDLSLNDNLISEVPDAIKQLTFLTSLDLGKNEIKTISNTSFDGLTKLSLLRMVDNFIENITSDAFSSLPELHIVNLASNRISTIERNSFESNKKLKAIRLDDNSIENIAEIFTTLSELVWVNISNNKIKQFDYVSIPVSVEWFNIGTNQIEQIEDRFKISGKHSLKNLDISNNKLISINNASFPDNIEYIHMKNNNIRQIDPHTFFTKSFIKKVDLIGNKLKSIDRLSIALSPAVKRNDIPEFYFEKNPLVCDCHMEWLQTVNDFTSYSHYPRIADLNFLECTLEGYRNLVAKPIVEVTSEEFLCKYEQHCFTLCHCCDFDACDCKMTCPSGCNCYHDSSWKSNIVDCGNAGFGKIPELIPMDVSTLYLDGNDFGELDSHIFIGKKKLENLYLNSSRIANIHNRTFSGIPSLRKLHLEDNQIEVLNGLEFQSIPTLSELYLDRNQIKTINNGTFTNLNELQILDLSDNFLKDFKPIDLNKEIIEISLKGGNTYTCACDNLFDITELLNNENLNNILCANNNINNNENGVSQQTISEFLNSCNTIKTFADSTESVKRTLLPETSSPDYILILIIIVILVIVLIIILTVCCFYNNRLSFWLHSKFGIRLRKDNNLPIDKNDDNAKLYDGYVIYSALDSNFIQDEFTNELESQGYAMCLHHRDIHSMAFLADSLQSAADASKRIILVISINFLQGEWSDPHFRIALHSTLELIRPACRKKKLIIVLTAPSNIVATDQIMEILLRTCTVINWGDKKFWDKIKFAMPDTTDALTSNRPDFRINHPIQRYTPAPTTLDMWYRRSCSNPNHTSPGIPGVGGVVINSGHKTPSQCTYNTEDELSSVSSQYNEPISQHNYNNRASLGHVYSTIPETTPTTRCEASYL